MCFAYRCIFSRRTGSRIPCIYMICLFYIKITVRYNLVPISFWNGFKDKFATSGCNLFILHKSAISGGKNAPIGKTHFMYVNNFIYSKYLIIFSIKVTFWPLNIVIYILLNLLQYRKYTYIAFKFRFFRGYKIHLEPIL